MVPTLYLSEKLRVGQKSILPLLELGVKSLACGRAIDTTLDGYELVLLGVARITLIVPKGGLKEISL